MTNPHATPAAESGEQKFNNPLELKWIILKEFGSTSPEDDVYVCAKDGERWWVILKKIAPTLAEHIVAIHNARYNHD